MMKRFAALAGLTAAACASTTTSTDKPKAPTATTSSSSTISGVAPGVVDAETARRLVGAGVRVVDVRTPAEYAEEPKEAKEAKPDDGGE
jgi:hypothetical protein